MTLLLSTQTTQVVTDAAKDAAKALTESGWCELLLTPGDGTTYDIVVVRADETLRVAGSFTCSRGHCMPRITADQVAGNLTAHILGLQRNGYDDALYHLFLTTLFNALETA